MEVHHPSHTSRKKWTHYSWEILMLFFAILCEFLARNKREYNSKAAKQANEITEILKRSIALNKYV